MEDRIMRNNELAYQFSKNRIIKLVILGILSLFLGLVIEASINLIFGFVKSDGVFNIYHGFFFAAIIFIVGIFFFLRNNVSNAPENLFLAIVLTVSCFSAWSFSVNQVSWDVESHYRFMLEFSDLDRNRTLSSSDEDMIYLHSTKSEFSLQGLSQYEQELNQNDSILTENVVHGSLRDLYKRLASLPGSAVYFVLNLFGLSFSIKYFASHLIYAVIYSFVLFFGMRKLKSGKMLFASIALLPTMVFLASNYSYDYWVNAFSMYGTACLIGELQRPQNPLRLKSAVAMLGSFVLAFGPKAIYFPLVMVCLLIPKSKFKNKSHSKWYRVAVVLTALFIASSFVLPLLIGGAGGDDMRGGSDVNSGAQIAFILTHPFEYAAILLKFLIGYLSPLTTREYFVNYAYLGYSSNLFWILSSAILVLTALTDKSSADIYVNNWKSRVLIIGLCSACVVLVPTALYVAFTGVGKEIIAGCQPRYLLPLLFPFCALIGTSKTAWPSDKYRGIYNMCVLGVMSFILFGGMWDVYVSLLQ